MYNFWHHWNNNSLHSYVTCKNHLGCQWTPEEKCGLMEGPCLDDSNCLFDLICEPNSCGGDISNNTRCCTQPFPCNDTHSRTFSCCNDLYKCNVNEGHCTDNNDCYGNLQCGTKNCDWSSEANCCTHPHNEGGKWSKFYIHIQSDNQNHFRYIILDMMGNNGQKLNISTSRTCNYENMISTLIACHILSKIKWPNMSWPCMTFNLPSILLKSKLLPHINP